jgi:hypothetical protein
MPSKSNDKQQSSSPSELELRVKRAVIQVVATQSLKDSLDVHASKLGLTLSEYCRNVLAKSIGYDLAKDYSDQKLLDRRGRPRKYDDDDARKAAKNERERQTRATTKQILDDYRHQLHIATGKQLADSLAKFDESSTSSTSDENHQSKPSLEDKN